MFKMDSAIIISNGASTNAHEWNIKVGYYLLNNESSIFLPEFVTQVFNNVRTKIYSDTQSMELVMKLSINVIHTQTHDIVTSCSKIL